jgi:hypothetical protein
MIRKRTLKVPRVKMLRLRRSERRTPQSVFNAGLNEQNATTSSPARPTRTTSLIAHMMQKHSARLRLKKAKLIEPPLTLFL